MKHQPLPAGVVDPENSYNAPPTPIEEISSDEFWHRFQGSEPEYRQVFELPGHPRKTVKELYIFWQSDSAIAVAPPNEWRCRKPEDGPGHGIVYTEPARYYYIGCRHEDDRECVGWCLNRYTCRKCGRSMVVDSSD